MSYGSISNIETIDSSDLESIATVSSLEGNTIQPDGRVNLPEIEEESTVPGHGFACTLWGICCERCHDTGQTWHGSYCSKIEAFFMCITTPFYVLLSPFFRARATRRNVTHHGIVYFYLVMACTIVFNLWEQRNKYLYGSVSYQFLQLFEASLMFLAVIAMLYIAYATNGEVIWTIHERNLIFYFRAGLYVFGVSSMVYTALNIYNNCSCSDRLNVTLNIAKFLFIVFQILFLNYYYQAKLPGCGWPIQVSLAHILGTNLSLWIWTVCKEVYEPKNTGISEGCNPIYLGHTEKYFYPLFVEYLLLVASMMYELWMDLNLPADARRLPRRDWIHKKYQLQLESGMSALSGASHPIHLVATGRRRRFAPSLAFWFVLALVLSCIFLAFILAASNSGKKDSKWYYNFIIANVCFYSVQLISCYVIKVCSQSQPANRKRSTLNLDDALLYFGLAGIILWEGFHFYALLFASNREPIHFVHGMLGLIEDIVQTVILVSVRRLSSRDDVNARTIADTSLFLLATNITFWLQNSFYIEQQLENPGENHESLKERLDVFANILNPIIIFFRFHSATCCYQMWVIFSHTNINHN